jgi:hypothetical protein
VLDVLSSGRAVRLRFVVEGEEQAGLGLVFVMTCLRLHIHIPFSTGVLS